jgi:hypothetical protein
LRAILNQQPSILSSITTSSSTEINPAALLALLLKQQGIEPSTPATNLREQLQLAVSYNFSFALLFHNYLIYQRYVNIHF